MYQHENNHSHLYSSHAMPENPSLLGNTLSYHLLKKNLFSDKCWVAHL